MKKDVYIIGTGSFANELTEYIESTNEYNILGYFDITKDEYNRYNFEAPYLGNENNFHFKKDENIIIGISDNQIRLHIYCKLKKLGLKFPNFIHKNSFISKNANIDEGAILCPFVTLTSNIKIGRNFIANIYSYIAHDCVIGNDVTFAPAVKCNGNVIIEDNVYIGTGVIIHQGKANKPLKIGKGAIIAAGSVVVRSIPSNTTVFGNPAIKLTKENMKRRK